MFNALPEELLTNILRHLDHPSLLACRLICHKINNVIQSSAELQYYIELGMDGLVDCAASSTPYSDRLATIIRRRHAWAAMEWNDTVSAHLPGECLAYELVADVLAKLTEAHEFVCVELPSMPRAADTGQMDASSIDTWDLPFAARDFAMDPTQDLVIFLEDTRIPVASEKSRNTHLYIYSMATKEPHQLAQSPCLVINGSESKSLVHPFVGHPFIICALLQIAEDVVLIQYTTLAAESDHIRLWNWMTGDLWLTEDYSMTCGGCGLLSARSFMLPSLKGCGSIQIYTLEFSNDSRTPRSELKATLLLPSSTPGLSLRSFTSHSPPIVARPLQSKMASPAAESHIHVMSVAYNAQFGIRFRLFVPNRVLLSYAAVAPGHAPMLVPWDTWGPDNTRIMEQGDTSTWLRFVHGTRVVAGPPVSRIPPLEAPTSQTVLQLYDFNPHCRRLHSSVQPINGAKAELQPETVVRKGLAFAETVTTRLPYRRVLHRFDKRYTSFFIDDERLLALEHTPPSGRDLNNIDIYTF
ncbi:hypothetical protein PC9H_011569 [Pleurotus ostreatus]|uniref:F-box domain-containing protein n=1 Tax=Pleurotus ostreatus TaxID=5322 RepID=A0A8H7DPD3_PLEOS|nr:uncharacterized protein PC9H_011569 [Pleurotus ostreatus]KAF7421049.1 hypothetical protein PC9H_011569 [Pleurotus ostreatus]KAJ8690557.1 hypothetical protein PTI98_011977 [Pleurotus ostreatus]